MDATSLVPSQTPLYQPTHAELSRTFKFLRNINSKYNLSLSSYVDLYRWSCTHIDQFWGSVWDEVGIIGHKGAHVVDNSTKPAQNPPWFTDANLNWAENMLQCRSSNTTAVIQACEPTPEIPVPPLRKISYSELYSVVSDLVSALLHHGLKPGDRIAAYSSNTIENIAACLAASAIGCIWVSAAADFGPEGVLERFEQVQPKVIFAVDAVVYNAKLHPHLPKLSVLLSGLAKQTAIQPKVIIIHAVPTEEDRSEWESGWESWESFVEEGRQMKLGRTDDGEIQWKRLAFDWPLWILFSSGTTGRPKPIVHRAGGMLLQSRKEFVICADLRPEDIFFYYTTTGWMMWNFLVSSLSIGCTLVLYDGSPLRDRAHLWHLTDKLGVTIFGTSAKYIDQLSKVYKPREHHSLHTLRHIYSTGSPLAAALFDYVHQHIREGVLLASITGGTDICSLFAGMCTALPVYRGEIQCRLLGMAIETFSPTGTINDPDEAGELVCLKPFPCQPVGFWPLSGFGTDEAVKAAETRYKQAYFEEFDDVWHHGDHVVITRSRAGNGGGLIMLGRSDGVLNPGGIRFGSAEIYDVIDACFSLGSPGLDSSSQIIIDCLAVGQIINGGVDERVILFVKLEDGVLFSSDLENRLKKAIRVWRSPRHVPSRIIQVADIPYTLNGKRVEVPVKKIINGALISSINPSTLRNPECLLAFEEIGKVLRHEECT